MREGDILDHAWDGTWKRRASVGRRNAAQREILLIALWPTGIPSVALARNLGVSHPTLSSMLTRVRKTGVDLPIRGLKHKPPPGWQARVDEIMARADDLASGVGGTDDQK